MEQEYDEQDYEVWQKHAVTRRLVKMNRERLGNLQLKLESAARHSPDADVRGAMAELVAQRVILAELLGKDSVEGAGQQ